MVVPGLQDLSAWLFQDPSMADKEAVLASLNINAMTFNKCDNQTVDFGPGGETARKGKDDNILYYITIIINLYIDKIYFSKDAIICIWYWYLWLV